MSRIATITTILTMLVAPAAFAGPVDLRSPDSVDRATPAKIDLRSPDAATPLRITAGQDLRSPDAVDTFVSPTSAPAVTVNDGNLAWWAFLAIVAGAVAACALLIVMLRRAFAVGRPLGA